MIAAHGSDPHLLDRGEAHVDRPVLDLEEMLGSPYRRGRSIAAELGADQGSLVGVLEREYTFEGTLTFDAGQAIEQPTSFTQDPQDIADVPAPLECRWLSRGVHGDRALLAAASSILESVRARSSFVPRPFRAGTGHSSRES